MIAERWRRVEELFAGAVALAPPARSGFLAERCGDDVGLREEVERLLAADGAAGEFLAETVEGGARAWAGEAVRTEVGRRIGPYRLEREIGRGGMSSVYLAVRADDEFRRRVAVKLVRRGMDTRDILDRFLTERQILANLDHPYIARLHDGGTTDDGLPYFVMDDYAEAEGIVRDLVAETRGSGDDEDLADLLEQLGQIRLARGDSDEAESLLRETLELRRGLFGDEHRDVARSLHGLGALYRERGDLAAAEPLLEAALDQRRRLLGVGHPEYVESLRETAALLAARGRFAEAEARYRRAIAIDTAALGADHPLTGLAQAGLGELLAAENDCAGAEPVLAEALRLMPEKDWRRPRAAAALAGCRE